MTASQARKSQPRAWLRIAVCLASLAPLVADSVRANEPAAHTDTTGVTIEGITTPARTIELAALVSARVRAILVDEGDTVPAGAVLIQLDDAVQLARTARAQREAESTLPIKLAEVRSAYAQRELERLQGLQANSVTSVKELLDAEAHADLMKLEHAWARVQHDLARREYETQAALLAQFTLIAPFPGCVSRLHTEVGATVEEREGVLTLMQLDPLIVVLDVPLAHAAQFKPGATCRVTTTAHPGANRTGRVKFVSPTADAGSQTVRVKLAVPNPDHAWRAGVQVRATLSESPTLATVLPPFPIIPLRAAED